jgi:hypothetical protein
MLSLGRTRSAGMPSKRSACAKRIPATPCDLGCRVKVFERGAGFAGAVFRHEKFVLALTYPRSEARAAGSSAAKISISAPGPLLMRMQRSCGAPAGFLRNTSRSISVSISAFANAPSRPQSMVTKLVPEGSGLSPLSSAMRTRRSLAANHHFGKVSLVSDRSYGRRLR